MEAGPVQVFIKNEQGQIWGPLALSTVELLFDSGIVTGKVMVSADGEHYALPGRFPEYRDAFPPEAWGTDAPANAVPRGRPVTEEILLGSDDMAKAPAAPKPTAGASPVAGPGAVATSAFTAGPGTAAAQRPNPPKPAGPPPAGPPPAGSPAGAGGGAPGGAAPRAAPAASGGLHGAPASGTLAAMSAVKVYARVAALEQTGLITFKLSDREIQLYLRKGNPEYVASSHPEDDVGAFLVHAGLCKAEQLAQATAQKDRFGGELLSALFGLGVLNPGTAFGQLIERAKSLLGRALLATDGSFTVESTELPSQKAMPLGNRWGVLAELVRRIPAPELRRRLQGSWALSARRSGGFVSASDLRLTPQETRAISYIDGVKSLAQLQVERSQEFETILRMVFFLVELDTVVFGAAAPPPASAAQSAPSPSVAPVPPAQPAAPKPAPPAAAKPAAPAAAPKGPAPKQVSVPVAAVAPTPAPTPAPGPPPAETVEQLRALMAKMKEQNHFEVLGVPEKTDAGQVKIAYLKLAKSYHPDTVSESAAPEIAKLKQDIFGRIGDANRTLSDDKLRADYLDELKHGGGEKVDVAQILLAEELFQKGCILVKARKWADAVKMLSDAIEANAEEPEFLAWRGYAKYFAATDRATAKGEAMKDISAALKRNDKIAAAHYFSGHIAKLTNDLRTAEQEFRRTVDLNPTHIDAQRELRMMGKK